MIKLIIFDLDGTLADTILDIKNGLNGMLGEYSFPLVSREQTLAAINNGATELVRRCLPEKYRADDNFVLQAKKVYEKYYSRCYNNLTSEYEGCSKALAELSSLGINLAVLSNKQDEFVKRIVDKLFCHVPFKCVMGQSEQFPTKPNPASAHHIMSLLGVRPEETVFVGDSNIDMDTAKNADVIPVGVSWGYRSSDILKKHGAREILTSPNMISSIASMFN